MRARGRMLVGAVGAVAVLCALVGARPVEAAWADGEYATASVASGALVAPTKGTCTGGVLFVTVNWTPPATGVTPQGYEVTVTRSNGTVVAGFPVLVAGASTTSWASGTLLSALIAGTYTISVKSYLENWRSGSAISWTATVAVLGLLVTC